MYDELVQKLRSVEDIWQSEEEQWMLDAADAIEKLTGELANKPKWISVTERLPGYGDYVLCIGPKWGYYICEYRGLILGLDLASRIPYFAARGKPVTVTHWMPLPEPPKEVDNGD